MSDDGSARPIISTFLARAVVDEILPPSFIMDPIVMRVGGDIVEQAKKKLSINHGTARLEKGWGPGDGRPVEELKVSIDLLMQVRFVPLFSLSIPDICDGRSSCFREILLKLPDVSES